MMKMGAPVMHFALSSEGDRLYAVSPKNRAWRSTKRQRMPSSGYCPALAGRRQRSSFRPPGTRP